MATQFAHRPVLLEKSLSLLELRPNANIVDGTLGAGGHAAEILARTAPNGILIGLDRDAAAIAAASDTLAPFAPRTRIIRSSFRDLHRVLAEADLLPVDGVILDLGVSSPQLDDPKRGFRFGSDTADDTALDMRMDPESGETAAALLRRTPSETLALWFRDYADLPGAHRLARAIVTARQRAPLRTSRDLRDVIAEAGVGRGRKHDPATLVFQALRIAVNDEMGALRDGLEAAIESLRPGGRLVVIAYHSAEDRIVKNCFRDAQRGCSCPPRMPVCICGESPRLRIVTKRPLGPEPAEVRENPRARSARLRAAERMAVAR